MDDHAKRQVENLLSQINHDYQDIRYSVYRVAMKLCHLQKQFKLEELSGSQVIKTFTDYLSNKLQTEIESICDEALSCHELFHVVSNMFNLLGVVLKSCKTLSTLIFETFKNLRENTVRVLPVLLFFVVLGGDDIKVKYSLLFQLYSGSLQVLSKSRLSLCLMHFVRITDIVGEFANFSRVKPAVESCFKGVLGSMISEQHLLKWLLLEPQSIVWLPTMHRLNASKTSVHQVCCATCKVRPIIGLRFQCLRCIDYDSCQVCFLTRKPATRSHRLNHPRQEYCLPAGSKQKVNALARTIRNMVTKRYKHKSLSSSYLPIEQNTLESAIDDDATGFDDVTHLADQEKQDLEFLVGKLREENKKITDTVEMLKSSKRDAVQMDQERVFLQSELDTVHLHNHSLKAELENLKCVLFSDRILSGGEESDCDDVGDLSSLENHNFSSQINTSQQSSLSSRSDISPKPQIKESGNPTTNYMSSALHEIVDSFTSSLKHEPLGGSKSEDRLMLAAEDVRDDLCDLIDASVHLQTPWQ